ncbi:MAG: hypothetical protein LBN27_07875 [Prevotellaceae bacterium]|jgi:microcystin-dependent protein|nr:hypothetical protein [Prevotellaceae bacterium]
MTAIKRTAGNFLNFATRNFPLDCEGMNLMQQNEALLSILGNIGGNRYIVKGCTAAVNYEGYVFLGTQAAPDGELLYVEPKPAGAAAANLYMVNEPVDISAQGYDYSAAYTQRHLAWGLGSEQYPFGSFSAIQTNIQLTTKVTSLQSQINAILPTPAGVIVMWSGSPTNIPEGWKLCNGQNGTPDLRGRFIVGYNPDDGDYNAIGKNGGAKTVTLSEGQMPAHNHADSTQFRFFTAIAGEGQLTGTQNGWGYTTGDGSKGTAASLDYSPAAYGGYAENFIGHIPYGSSQGNAVAAAESKDKGGNQAHENRPPYYTLAYIMKS